MNPKADDCKQERKKKSIVYSEAQLKTILLSCNMSGEGEGG
jgi:hypothetical protein